MANLPRRNDENPNKATTITKDSTEYISISQGGVAKVIKSADLMTKGNVGLGNVENIAPADMPISEAQGLVNNAKADKTYVDDKNTTQDTEIASNTANSDLALERQDVVLENSIINGDFSDGTNNWLPSLGILSTDSTDFIINNSGTDTALRTRQSDVFDENDVYFVRFEFKSENTAKVFVSLRYYIDIPYDYTQNKYNKISTEITASSIMFLELSFDNIETTSNIRINKDYGVLALNLTDIFCKGVTGTGKEPNADLMQKFIEQTGYFNDFHTMTNKEIALAYSEYMKDIATAITELGGSI